MKSDLLTEDEVAERLTVRVATIQSWRYRGCGPELPYIKLGRSIRYRLADVERVLAEGTRPSGRAA